jgi:hypothetical protein
VTFCDVSSNNNHEITIIENNMLIWIDPEVQRSTCEFAGHLRLWHNLTLERKATCSEMAKNSNSDNQLFVLTREKII